MEHKHCTAGTYEGDVEVRLPSGKLISVDPCIEDLVVALNHSGLGTVASCCGHGKRPGSIILEDGRELFITESFKESRAMDALINMDIHGEKLAARPGVEPDGL